MIELREEVRPPWPFRLGGASMDSLLRRRGAALPPISVFRIGASHYVDDGHHRVSVAAALGMVAIDAEVVELNTKGA